MIHNWKELTDRVITNARGKKLDGSPGTWDSALYQLIHEACRQELDEDDRYVVVVFMALHDAINRRCNLEELAELCARHASGYKNLRSKIILG